MASAFLLERISTVSEGVKLEMIERQEEWDFIEKVFQDYNESEDGEEEE